uniref:Prosaposin n=1 Tax=Sphenodon punctatus TaxID=8508 RepID=A0A8D0HAY8_SPHPU
MLPHCRRRSLRTVGMQYQLFLFSCLLAAAVASPLLWQNDCVKGPEVWCQNLQTASQCGAVKHCQQTVWSKPTVKSIPCDLCKEVVTVAGKLLKDNVTEDKPEVVCQSLCLCQSLQKHLAAMKLQKQLQSNKIPKLDFSELASPFIANVPLLLNPQDKPKEEVQEGGNVCTDCVQLVTDIQEAVRTNSSFVDSLVNHAKQECDRLGPGVAELCKNYISQYSDLAIQMMMHMQPKDICSMAGFCPSLKSVPLQTLVPAKVIQEANVEPLKKSMVQAKTFSVCDICETMVKEVTSLLESNKTEEEMVYEMEKVCSVLPESIQEQCRGFVETYGKAVIDMLLEATLPETVCVLLKLCANDGALPAEKMVPEQTQANDFCDVCKMVVAYADKELEKNATEAEIEAVLEKVCHFLPESFTTQCVQFVQQYEPMVVQLLAEMMDPAFVCSKLGVCVSSKLPLLGSDACVWGPGYWCKNMETASQCNAVEHCKRHVWN